MMRKRVMLQASVYPGRRMHTRHLVAASLLTLCTIACEPAVPTPVPSTPATQPAPASDALAIVPDSAWIDVTGPTLIGFYPVVSNEQLEKDEGLATALDDFAFHLGTAQDSLQAAGFTVHFRGGDTLWLRTGANRARVVRAADSSEVGYLFADTLMRRVFVYGVRGGAELVAYAHEFRRTGTLKRENR